MNVITLFIATLISVPLVMVQGQDCQPKERFATVDDNFTVYFQPCHGDDSCSGPLYCEIQDETIVQAGIDPHSSGNVSWNTTSFKVEFSKGDLVNGSHRYELWYEYQCITEFCTNSGMHLRLRIAEFPNNRGYWSADCDMEFRLELESSNVTPGGNTTFHCSSGLVTADEIRVNFTFTSKEGNTTNFSCDPRQKHPKHYNNRWIISRNPNKPHDCSLEVIDVSLIDSGTYQCFGLLPTDNPNVYENAYSNVKKIDLEPDRTIHPASVTDSEPDWTIHPESVTDDTPLGPSTSLLSIYAVGIVGVLIAIMVVIAIIGWRMKKRKGRLPPDPEQVPLLFGDGTRIPAERRQSCPPSSNDDASTEESSTSLLVTPPGSNSSDEPGVVFAMDNNESSGGHDQHRDIQVEVYNELHSSRAGSIESDDITVMERSSDDGGRHSTLATTPHFSESEEPRLKIIREGSEKPLPIQDDALVSVGSSTKQTSLPHIPTADWSTQNHVKSDSEGEKSRVSSPSSGGVSDDNTRQNDLQSSKSETESEKVLSVPSGITGVGSGESDSPTNSKSDDESRPVSHITGIPSEQSDSSTNSKGDDESRAVPQDDLGSISMFSESTKSSGSVHSNVESNGSEEGDKRTENPLLKDIDDDERSAAQGVYDQGQLLKETPVVENAPIDQNLICPYCEKGYIIGHICYYARHVNDQCPKAPKSGVSLSQSPQGLPTGVPGGTASDAAGSPSSLDCQFCGDEYQINHFKEFAIHVRNCK